MAIDLLLELREGLDGEGSERIRYTEKAFRMLPPLDPPRILDVGCGRGGPTLKLARLSGGQVIGLELESSSLAAFARRIEQAGLSDRVQAARGSMFALSFPDGRFDVVWAEGAIWVIGFERGLREWRRLIKPGGFLVVHEMAWIRPDPPPDVHDYWKARYPRIRTVPEYLEVIPSCGYATLGHFALPEDTWWEGYYEPLQARIQKLRRKYAGDPEAQAVLDGQQGEVDLYKKQKRWYGSAYFIMQRRDG